jgi:hypothetical protein
MGEKAVISNLAVARGFVPDPDPMPLPTELNGKTKMYNWPNTLIFLECISPPAGESCRRSRPAAALPTAMPNRERSLITDWHAGSRKGHCKIWDDRSPDFHEDPE